MGVNEFTNCITVLLEPTAECNLRCKHCYHAKTKYYEKKMSKKTFDKFLSITAPHYKNIKIIWHGGEPILAGYDFFKYAYTQFDYYTKRYKTNFDICIQTNGTLLDERFILLFKKTNTALTISYDGEYNDILRHNTNKVEKSMALLKRCNVKFDCLSTISSSTCNKLLELYNFFESKSIPSKFNPIVPDGAATKNTSYLISKEDWADNFIKLFNYWFFDAECNIYFASCCDMLVKYLELSGNGCLSGICMFRYIAVDAFGNLYPCGRLIEDDFLLGNLHNLNDIREAYLSDKYNVLLEQNKKRISNCKSCYWFSKCHSGCNASANLNSDLTKPYEFDCYFNHRVFEAIEKILSNYEINKINKYAREILIGH